MIDAYWVEWAGARTGAKDDYSKPASSGGKRSNEGTEILPSRGAVGEPPNGHR